MVKTVLDTLQSGVAYLEDRGVENGRLNMEWMLAEVLGCDRMGLYLQFDRPLHEKELEPLRTMARRRGQRVPLQHLLGWVEFCGHRFRSDARALVPRPETEELTAWLLEQREWVPDGARVVDVGTGSGVIALSLACAWRGRGVRLRGVDISPDALSLARENREALEVGEEECALREGDLLEGVDDASAALVVANLPYVAAAEMERLDPEVAHDPRLALEGGADGLVLVRRLVETAPRRLLPGGRLVLEVGHDQGEAAARCCREQGFGEVSLRADLSGIPRFVSARNPV